MPSKRTTRRKNGITSYPGLGEIPVREDLLVSKRAARGREMEERRARKVDVLPIDHELLLRFQDSDKEACDMLHGQNKRRRSTLTREERLKSTIQNWDRQLDRLADSYNIYINRLQIEIEPFPDPILSSESNYFDVTVWDLSERRNRKFLYDPDNSISANVALLRFGYIGAAPLSPSIAFHMRIFNAYEEKRTSSEKCPSLYAEAKVLSEKLGVPYRQIFGQQMLAAYEAYLKILRHFKERQLHASPINPISNLTPIDFNGIFGYPLYGDSHLQEDNTVFQFEGLTQTLESKAEISTYW